MPDTKPDVIVIGGGIAGLSCAAYLARAGKAVPLFEQHQQPGGYWTSFIRHGVVFDITPHWTIAPGVVNRMLADHLESFFPGEELRGLRTSLHLLAPIPGISAIGVIAMVGIALRGLAHSPVGGAQMIGNAFAEAARRSGADVRFSQRVRRVLLENGKAAGVELSDGGRLSAPAVVGAMDAHQLYRELLDPGQTPPSFQKKLDAYPVSSPYVIVSLVTDLDPATWGFDGTDTFVTASADLGQGLAPNDPEHSFYELVFPRYRAPGADPAHHGVQIVSPATFEYAGAWQAGPALDRGARYREFKLDYATRLIKRAEERLPGLSEHTIAVDVATPVTMVRYTLNYQGAPVGWGYNNPLRWTQRAPGISGLYQAGHWVGPSGVVNAATSGKHAAELVLRDLG